MNGLQQILRSRGVVIVAGSGGVGKTTVSASLAIAGALDGRKTLVVTIDPAKRLAQSLGLPAMGHEPENLTSNLTAGGLKPKGELWGMMLDMKATLDGFVESVVRDPRTRDLVLQNKIYEQVTGSLSGSQEYAAMHKLHELRENGLFDLIILDTPPTTHAIDFLRAPDKLTRFFASGVVQLLTGSDRKGRGGLGRRLLQRGSDLFLGAVEKLTGAELVREVTAFFDLVQNAFEPLSDHGRTVEQLLRSPDTEFVIVCGPQGGQVDEAVQFFRQVTQMGISAGAVIVNRVVLPTVGNKEFKQFQGSADPLHPHTMLDWVSMYEELARVHAAHLKRVEQDVGKGRTFAVDAAPRDLHSLDGLRWIGEQLFGTLFK